MAKKIKRLQGHLKGERKILFASADVLFDPVQEGEQSGLPKFSMVAYSGGEMRWWWDNVPLVCDLSNARLSRDSIPILRDHDDDKIVGHTTDIKIGDGKIVLSGVISGENEYAKEIAATGKNKFPWQASIGTDYGSIESYQKGQSVSVNGRTFFGPVDVARDLVIYETSFCVFGADDQTSAMISANRKLKGAKMLTFEEWAVENGYDLSTMDEAQIEELKIEYDAWVALQGSEEAACDPEEKKNEKHTEASKRSSVSASILASRKETAEETRRVAEIKKLCAGRYIDLEAKAIETGLMPIEVENRILRAEKVRDRVPPIKNYNSPDAPGFADVITASALGSHGVSGDRLKKLGFDDRTINASQERKNRSMGLQGVIANTIQAMGGHIQAGLSRTSFYDAARSELQNCTHRINASLSSFSTLSLSGILSNIANKSLLDGWMYVEPVIRRVCATVTHKDFKGMTSYRLLDDGLFKKVPPAGKIESMGLGEESYQNKIETYGRLITLTRQMIINDDLSAFTDLPRRMGINGGHTLERIGWATFLASIPTLCTTPRRNVMTMELSPQGLNQAAGLLAKTETNKDDYSGFTGKFIIASSDLEAKARILYRSTTIFQTTGDNPVYNLYEPIISPFFAGTPKNPATNGSTQWAMITDPNLSACLELALLDGKEQPTVEDETAAFDVLGVMIRAYMDFGFAPREWQGIVYSDGTTAPPPITP